MNIDFSTFQLIIESDFTELRFVEPLEYHFSNLEVEFKISEKDSVRDFKTELNDEYLWISVEFGSANPRRDTIININTLDETANKRDNTQAELTKQSFFLYSFKTKLLYLSNSKQIAMFTKVLKEKLSVDFIIRKIFKNKEEFLAILKGIDRISFSNFDNLFTHDCKERRAVIDLTGTDAPQTFSIEAIYPNQVLHNIIPFINKLFQSKAENKLSNLMISGLDESGFQAIYNEDTFTNKINVSGTKNNEGLFDSDQIKTELIRIISNEG